MAERKLPPEGSAELASLYKRYREGESAHVLREAYGFSTTHNLRQALAMRGVFREVKESPTPRYNKPPRVGSDLLVIADTQIPFYDAGFINNLFALAQKWGLKQLVMAGDVADMTSLTKAFHQKPEHTLTVERKLLLAFLEVATESFTDILWLAGNHEQRFGYTLNDQVTEEMFHAFFAPFGSIKVSGYTACLADGKWKIGHPRNASVIGTRVPVLLGDVDTEYNIAGGHGHLMGLTRTKDGKRWACDIGVTCDSQRLDWVAERWSTRPKMCQGALILKKVGAKVYPYHLSPDSDWAALGRLYG